MPGSWALALLLLLSCNKEEPALPIPEDELVSVLVDVHLAEAALQDAYGAKKDSLAELYYNQIYRLHDIEEEAFNKAIKQLRNEPERVERLYERVLEELSIREAQMEAEKED